ncbi:helix-turn-helix transcriptional regulator [Brumicola nitratireducens]|uniref:Phage transcriptional regulator, AlpA n=1 Tax=Glaciecola nitratireducens (strain JCM 12485 / KCTC 12276 / FR1064) TaxID=1085623 RepID=G4QH95_GLANF|nr:AlpA family phage regulatory protein [Glaciecola nitratireducens]AEP29726.1 phage transcriptional regulator, AlpA [Glaciecola nitratireducens FR1064]
MTITFSHRVIRRPETLSLIGCSKTTLHYLQKQRLFVKPINIGQRAVGYLEHEVQAIIAARAANQSDSEIRFLVEKLEETRTHSANAFLKSVVQYSLTEKKEFAA